MWTWSHLPSVLPTSTKEIIILQLKRLSALTGLAASAITLFIFTDSCPALAATFGLSGKFNQKAEPGTTGFVLQLEGGSFDGYYSTFDVDNLPIPSNSSIGLKDWSINVRDAQKNVLEILEPGTHSVGTLIGHSPQWNDDVLVIGNGSNTPQSHAFQLVFSPNFSGNGSVLVPGSPSYQGSYVPSAYYAYPFKPDTIGVAEARSQEIPTPALLPGLIGMGIAVWKKRKGSQSESVVESSEV